MSFEMVIERDVPIPLGDGVCLAGDVYRPNDGARHPTLVHRTPYGKGNVALVNDLIFSPIEAVERGFAVVVQDVRGTGASGGEFAPLTQERADGHDTLDWVATQPWSDGTFGIYGSSYMGATALQAAVDAPSGLKAVFAYITGSTYQSGWIRSGGVLEIALNVRWTLAQLAAQLQRPERAGVLDSSVTDLMGRFGADPIGELRRTIDPSAFGDVLGKAAPFFCDWLDRPAGDDYWKALDIAAAAAAGRIAAPVLHVAGWYDGFLGEHLELQRALPAGGDHRFIVGPWTHDAYFGVFTASTAGTRNFGPTALGGRAGLATIALDWFEHRLRGSATASLPPVRYFQMGANQWRPADQWPPPHTIERWHLHSGGRANTRGGDGRLALAPPGAEPADTYVYDPAAPAPTTGGAHMAYGVTETGVHDQGELEERTDVLVYTSAHLLEPLTIVGPVTVELHVLSSAPTTAFVATLVDVDEAGTALNIADGVQRLEQGDNTDVAASQLVVIDLRATAYTVAAGHRVRIHITSSSFPRLERCPDRAVQHVLHDAGHPSALTLAIPEVTS